MDQTARPPNTGAQPSPLRSVKSGYLLLRTRWASVTGVWKRYFFVLYSGYDGAYLEAYLTKPVVHPLKTTEASTPTPTLSEEVDNDYTGSFLSLLKDDTNAIEARNTSDRQQATPPRRASKHRKPSFKFNISRVYSPRRYASKRQPFVFQIFSSSLDVKEFKQSRKASKSKAANATQSEAGRVATNLQFSNKFKRGKSLVLAAPSFDDCKEWLDAVSSINALNQQASLSDRLNTAIASAAQPNTKSVDTIIQSNKEVVKHILRFQMEDLQESLNGSPQAHQSFGLATLVDFLYRFYNNALVYDVVCYCLSERLSNGMITPRNLLFFLPQILVALRKKAACSSNTSLFLEQILFSCLVALKSCPAERLNFALHLYWAFVSELPRLPDQESQSENADGAAAGKNTRDEPMLLTMDGIRSEDIYLWRLLLILEYFLYRRPLREASRNQSPPPEGHNVDAYPTSRPAITAWNKAAEEELGAQSVPRSSQEPEQVSRPIEEVEEPQGWWMSPTVLRSGEAFHAKFSVPVPRHERSYLRVAFFKAPHQRDGEGTSSSGPAYEWPTCDEARSVSLQELQWAICSPPVTCTRSSVAEFQWEASHVPKAGPYIVVVFSTKTRKPICWKSVTVVRADFLIHESETSVGTSGLQMLDDYTQADVLPAGVASVIHNIKTKAIDAGILVYLSAHEPIRSKSTASTSPEAQYRLLSATELRLINRFVVQNTQERYSDIFASNRRFVASLIKASESVRELEPEKRRDALRAHLNKLQVHHSALIEGETDQMKSGAPQTFPALYTVLFAAGLDDMPPSPQRIVRLVPEESIVFNTRERAPYLLCVETVALGQSLSLAQTTTAAREDERQSVDLSKPDSGERKEPEVPPSWTGGAGVGSLFARPATSAHVHSVMTSIASPPAIVMTPRSLYFDSVNQTQLEPSYSCQGWMHKGRVHPRTDAASFRQRWKKRFFRLHPRSRTLSYFTSAHPRARPKGTLVLPEYDSDVRVAAPNETNNHKRSTFLLSCRNADGHPVQVYLSTSKRKTMKQWIRRLRQTFNGVSDDVDSSPTPSPLQKSRSGNNDESAQPPVESELRTIAQPLPVSWLATNVGSFVVSEEAGRRLRMEVQSQNSHLTYTATHSHGATQFVMYFLQDTQSSGDERVRASNISVGDILAAIGDEIVIGYSQEQVLAFLMTKTKGQVGADGDGSEVCIKISVLRTSWLESEEPLVEAIAVGDEEPEPGNDVSHDSIDAGCQEADEDSVVDDNEAEARAAQEAFRLAQAASQNGTYPTRKRHVSTVGSLSEVSEGRQDNGAVQQSVAARRQDSFETLEKSQQIAQHDGKLPKTVNSKFGETWQQKAMRVARASSLSGRLGWDLKSIVVKSYDDLRQERFVLQMAAFCDKVWADKNGLPLRLHAYSIVATGPDSGFIETISNAQSLDQVKKKLKPGETLSTFFEQSFSASSRDLRNARIRFAESLAASCIFTYLLLVKDRHNGNIMLRSDGMLVHIDFGFILGHAPGGRFSLERAPFKLTAEMANVMGGMNSPLWTYFEGLVISGFWALRQARAELESLLIIATESDFPCMQGADKKAMLSSFRSRLMGDESVAEVVHQVRRLLYKSCDSKWSWYYDEFQRVSNGIAP